MGEGGGGGGGGTPKEGGVRKGRNPHKQHRGEENKTREIKKSKTPKNTTRVFNSSE